MYADRPGRLDIHIATCEQDHGASTRGFHELPSRRAVETVSGTCTHSARSLDRSEESLTSLKASRWEGSHHDTYHRQRCTQIAVNFPKTWQHWHTFPCSLESTVSHAYLEGYNPPYEYFRASNFFHFVSSFLHS